MTSIVCDGGSRRGEHAHDVDGFTYATCRSCGHLISCTRLGIVRPHMTAQDPSTGPLRPSVPLSQLSLFDYQLTLF
jgi:hypothetical protein